jgi:LPXTG-site transpeptidase (sortase) family protein
MLFRPVIALLAFLAVIPVQTGFAAENDIITRGGAIALLTASDPDAAPRVQWYRENMPPVALFADVQQHLWYAPYIEAAFEQRLIKGGMDGTIRPGAVLTSHDAALLLSRAWIRQGALLFLQWSDGEYYVPTLQDVATAYGLRTPVGPRPMPRSEFVEQLQRLYGNTAVASIPSDSMAWTGSASPQRVSLLQTAMAPIFGQPETPIPPSRQAAQPAAPRPITTTPNTPVIRPALPAVAPVAHAATTDAFTISLPTLGINSLAVHHPSNPFTHQGLLDPLKDGVGHLFSYPGRGGKVLIYGHSSSFAWDVSPYTKIFRRINELAIGDRVTVTYDGLVHTYVVREKKTVPAADLTSYQNDGEGEELILYTCWPPDSISQRYLVIADPV